MAAARDELVYWQMLREHLVNNAPQSVASIALNPSLRMNGPVSCRKQLMRSTGGKSNHAVYE